MSDIILIVDRNNTPIGSAQRHEAHAEGLIHRIVRLFVFNDKGEIFLQKRSMTVDNSPGLWDQSAAGHVDIGETDLEAVRREAREEIGLDVDQPTKVGTYFTESEKVSEGKMLRRFNVLYAVETDQPITIDQDEVVGGEWLSLTELRRRIARSPEDYTGGFAKALEFYDEKQSTGS